MRYFKLKKLKNGHYLESFIQIFKIFGILNMGGSVTVFLHQVFLFFLFIFLVASVAKLNFAISNEDISGPDS